MGLVNAAGKEKEMSVKERVCPFLIAGSVPVTVPGIVRVAKVSVTLDSTETFVIVRDAGISPLSTIFTTLPVGPFRC
jgi:hypothetical protein